MRANVLLSSCLPLFAACRSAPLLDTCADPAAVAIAHLHREVETLASAFATGQQIAAVTTASIPASIPDTIALEARLGALTDRLDELLARLPAPAPAAGRTVDASSHARPVADAACVEALRAAIAVVDRAQQVCIENLANVNTWAFKKRELAVVSVADERTGMALPREQGLRTLFTAGALEVTGRSLDVAIDGEGWFAVRDASSGAMAYARDGRLQVNAEGKLVTCNGDVLLPEITLPDDTLEVAIDPAGTVTGRRAGNPDLVTRFGQLTLARFRNPDGLGCGRGGAFGATPASGPALMRQPGTGGIGLLKQGCLERSNVVILDESVDLQAWRRQRVELRRALAGYGVFAP